ncbi:hypothetical protein [Planctomicrobium sp. SH664]|uniref:hypothetical protein n=1 Tax=Planctomicrobium sp. SH664 TaxID=3448125 RepID=UPI003F5C03BC
MTKWQILGALLMLLPMGCTRDDGPKLYPVSGQVTFQGKPIDSGRVVFVPDRSLPETGPVHAAIIRKGRFEGKASEGKKTVEIHAEFLTGKTGTREDGTTFPEVVGLPEKYSTASLLEVTIQPGENENVDFLLQ